MFWQLLTALLFLQLSQPAGAASEGAQPTSTKALQFGSTLGDYVKFSPDMSPVKNAMTLCAWIRKQLTGDRRSWITYTTSTHGDEILISDAGLFNVIHGTYLDLRSAVTVPLNTWTYQCQSWSKSSGTVKVYYNGTLIGTKSVSSAPLEEGGYILLGHDSSSQNANEIFGGQLMKLNIFGKELSGTEVAELYNGGRCSEVEKKHQEVRFITWESIMSQDRTGNVSEVDAGCPAPEEEAEEETDAEECQCQDKPHSMWDILFDETYLNQTLTDEKLTELKAVWNILDHFVGATITEGIIAHFKMFHPKGATGCDGDTDS